MGKPGLTQQEEDACLNVLRGFNYEDAYIAAGFTLDSRRKKLGGQARDFFRRPAIADRIRELRHLRAMAAIEEGINVEAEMAVLYQQTRHLVDSSQLAGDIEGTISSTAQARKLLEGIARLRGLYVDRKEVGKPGEFANLKADELRQRLVTELKAAGVTEKAITALIGAAARG